MRSLRQRPSHDTRARLRSSGKGNTESGTCEGEAELADALDLSMLAGIQGAGLLINRTVATSQPHNVARLHQLAITVEQRRVHLGGVVGYDEVVHRVALLGLRSALLFEHDEKRVDDFIAWSQGVELLPRPAADEPQRRCVLRAAVSETPSPHSHD